MKTETAVTVKERSSAKIKTALVAVMLSVLLNTGFTLMVSSTFGIGFKVSSVIISSLITSLIFTGIYLINKKWISFAVLSSAPVIFTLCFIFDWFNVKKGLLALLYYIKLYVFLWLPGDYAEDPTGGKSIFAFFVAYNLVTISISAFVLMKRRWIPAALGFYAPMFLCSVTNTDVHPQAAPCLISGAGIILILLSNAFRKKRHTTYERMLLVVTLPVIAFMFMLGGLFPQEKYNKDKLAEKILIEMRDRIDRAAGRDNFLRDLIERALNGYENSDFDESFDAISPLYSTPTNLNKVGPFNPSNAEVLKILRSSNPEYSGKAPVYAGSVLYLKVESSDHYANNMLSNTGFKGNVFIKGAEFPMESAQYGVTVTPLRSSSVDIVPYYTDHYRINNGLTTKLNPYCYTREHIFTFGSANIPVRAGNIYSENYLNDYVYKTCLEVPYATDRALITSGKLPQWYLDVYNGSEQMSDADKIRGVTEFVRNLHPYNINTAYPPKGADFVPWFVKDAESGICVHYAATSMILLRMIGIPTRYVRGYVDVTSNLDSESIVDASQAHAWFEVFIPEYGWVMGDATPGYGLDQEHFNIDAISRIHPEIESADLKNGDGTDPANKENETETTEETTEATTTATDPPDETGGTSASQSGPGENNQNAPDYSNPYVPAGSDSSDGNSGQKGSGWPAYVVRTFKLFITIVITAAVLTLLVIGGRFAFIFYWKRRFNAKSINETAIAYYHYFVLMGKIFKVSIPPVANELAEKATFSGCSLTWKEYNALVSVCKIAMSTASRDFSRYKLYAYKLLKIYVPELRGE